MATSSVILRCPSVYRWRSAATSTADCTAGGFCVKAGRRHQCCSSRKLGAADAGVRCPGAGTAAGGSGPQPRTIWLCARGAVLCVRCRMRHPPEQRATAIARVPFACPAGICSECVRWFSWVPLAAGGPTAAGARGAPCCALRAAAAPRAGQGARGQHRRGDQGAAPRSLCKSVFCMFIPPGEVESPFSP